MKTSGRSGTHGRRRKRGRRTTQLRDLAQNRFHGCEVCRPDYAFDYLEEVLSPLRMTPAEERRLSRALWCPYCETALEDFPFNRVVAYTETELSELRRHQAFLDRYARCFDTFNEFMVSHPLLGGLHPIGIKLARAVHSTPYVTMEPATWYRARRGKQIQGEPTEQDLLPPDPRYFALNAGRFNSAGQLGYYLATYPETAAAEILPHAETVALMHDRNPQVDAGVVAQHLKVPTLLAEQLLKDRIESKDILVIGRVRIASPVKVLDLRVSLLGESPIRSVLLEGLVHVGALRRPTDHEDQSLPQYRVPQYIADLVRRRGLAGIVYSSSRGLPEDFPPTNLVLFRVEDGGVKVLSMDRYRWRGLPESDSLMDIDPVTKLEEVTP